MLDVGTGDGTYAIEAAVRDGIVTAIDPDPSMLAAARVRTVPRGVDVMFHRASVERLPFEDRSFDVVFAVTVLCFVADPMVAFREMTRVLAPGGRLVVGELARFSLWAVERRVRGWLGARTWRRARFWSRRGLRKIARRAGLRVIDVRGAVYFPPNGLAARLVAPLDACRRHAPGAAFLALAAHKPELDS